MPVFTSGELLIFLTALLVAAAPAALFLRFYAPDLTIGEVAVLGTVLGLAVGVAVLTWLPFVWPWLAWALVIGWLAAAAAAWKFGRSERPAPAPTQAGHAWLLAAVLIVQFALLLLPSRQNPLPLGNDAVYHVSISDKLVHAGAIPDDFLPYDPVAPTYTLGSHLLIAFTSLRTSLPVHRVYQFAMPLCLVLLSGLIGHLGRQVFGARAGWFAALVFAFLTNWGSLDLLRWGSVPNAAGMACFVAAARCLIAPIGPVPALLPAVFIGAMAATHHLSALTFGLVCTVWVVRHARRHGLAAPFVRRTAAAWGIGLCLVLPGVWALAAEVLRSLRSREAAALDAGIPYLNVVEPLIPVWAVPANLGVAMTALAAFGLWTTIRARAGNPLAADVLAWTATLAGAFAVLDWPLRWTIDAIWGRDLAILTPSRFLTNLSYPLCLLAGVGCSALWRASRKLAYALVVAAPIYALVAIAPLRTPYIPPAEIEGLRWFGANAPPESLLLQAPVWTTYVSGREGDLMVLREERLSGYTETKRALANRGTPAIQQWIRTHHRPVYLWESRELSVVDLERVWAGSGVYIYRFRL